MKRRIITIGREFGSGGRELGRRISEKLQLAYYDREIVTEIAKRTSLSEEYVDRITSDRPFVSYPIHIGMSFYDAPDYALERYFGVYAEQHRLLEELSVKSDCVIVGRCADYILREKNPFRKMKRNIRSIDKGRARYYNYFSQRKWGARDNCDLLINTSGKDIRQISEATADYLKSYLFDR